MHNLKTNFELCIVIPSYNEANRLNINDFNFFLNTHKDVLICFVNDGSRDNTKTILEQLASNFKENCTLLSLDKNQGKAAAVRQGFLFSKENFSFNKIAYLDSDLATSLEECYQISKLIKDKTIFAFGSRISKIDTQIDRKKHRFLIGRFIATLISKQLNLKVYDTQCGCKVFKSEIVTKIFKEKFISKWLFDVEIFHRLIKLFGKQEMLKICKEVPLNVWIDKDESKVKMTYFFTLWKDLLYIRNKYKSPKTL